MYLVGLIFLGCFTRGAQAFSCTSNGVGIGGTGTFTIPVNVTLNKTTSSIILSDLSTNSTCTGDTGTYYQDALKTISTSLNSSLVGLGYSGFIISSGSKYSFPATSLCLWPDSACSVTTSAGQRTVPLNVQIGMERTTFNNMAGTTIATGTEIARFQVTQRGRYYANGSSGEIINAWSANKTWIFTLKNALVIPSYTCSWNNPNQTVTLPPVMKKDLIASGAGKYPEPTPYKLNLTCDKDTTVSVQFDGTTMAGKTDVLANSAGENQDVGVQLVYNSAPVVFAQKVKVIDNSDTQETLSYQAHYYYNGGANIQGGAVNATTTVTFTYQ